MEGRIAFASPDARVTFELIGFDNLMFRSNQQTIDDAIHSIDRSHERTDIVVRFLGFYDPLEANPLIDASHDERFDFQAGGSHQSTSDFLFDMMGGVFCHRGAGLLSR